MATDPSTTAEERKQTLPPAVILGVLAVVIVALIGAAFVTFGPKPEPQVRYSPAQLLRAGRQTPGSMTPDQKRVYDRLQKVLGHQRPALPSRVSSRPAPGGASPQ